MDYYQQILDLFKNDTEESFNSVALNVFALQAETNLIYKRYLKIIGCDPLSISSYHDIPLFPISLFKQERIQTGSWQAEKMFLSSGTTQDGMRSLHLVKSLAWYDTIAQKTFINKGFNLDNIEIIGLLPSYIENGDSSLVHMVTSFQKQSKSSAPANYLHDFKALDTRIRTVLETTDKSILLIGVTFALLDFSKAYPIDNERLKIIFTGGMKRKRSEMTFGEIVRDLHSAFTLSAIHSEYGMTEMLSQAYSNSNGLFSCGPTLRVLSKQLQDPFVNAKYGKTGMLGLIDLANIDSLAFILSEDLSLSHSPQTFQVLGRMEESDIRGCNLLYEQDYFL